MFCSSKKVITIRRILTACHGIVWMKGQLMDLLIWVQKVNWFYRIETLAGSYLEALCPSLHYSEFEKEKEGRL